MSDTAIDTIYTRVAAEPTDMWEHMAFIKTCSSQCSSVVEFGVYDCTSTWALLAGHPKTLTSYDIARRPEVDEVEKAAADSSTRFTFILADTRTVEIEETDLLFIDAGHFYEELKVELATNAGKVRKLILMHDTTLFAHHDESYQGRGLWPAIEEFLAAHPEWVVRERVAYCHGMTTLARV